MSCCTPSDCRWPGRAADSTGAPADLRELELDPRRGGRALFGAPGGAVDLARVDVAAVVGDGHARGAGEVLRVGVRAVGALHPRGGGALDVGHRRGAHERQELVQIDLPAAV